MKVLERCQLNWRVFYLIPGLKGLFKLFIYLTSPSIQEEFRTTRDSFSFESGFQVMALRLWNFKSLLLSPVMVDIFLAATCIDGWTGGPHSLVRSENTYCRHGSLNEAVGSFFTLVVRTRFKRDRDINVIQSLQRAMNICYQFLSL